MPKKKKKWPIVVAVCACAGVLGVWGISSVASNLNRAFSGSVQTAEVVSGVIDTTVVGTGTLAFDDTENVSVPSGLTIASVLYTEGQTVHKGDLLASVEQEGCELRMSETYAQISELDEKLAETSSEPELVRVKAPVSGRVAAVYAGSGASVLDTAQENGCVLLIAAGNQLKVTVDSDNQPASESAVTVVLPDGTEQSAIVQTLRPDGFEAVLSGVSAAPGTQAEVRSTDGASYGTGILEPSNAFPVLAPSGTIEAVEVSEGQSIERGSLLFTVRPDTPPSSYLDLERQRTALAEEYEQLVQIRENGGIVSPADGVITSCLLTNGMVTSETTVMAEGGGETSFPVNPSEALSAFGISLSSGPETPVKKRGASSVNLLLEAEMEPAAEPPAASEETPDPAPEPSVPPASEPPAPSASSAPQPTQGQSFRPITAIDVPVVPPIPGLPLQTQIQLRPVYEGSVHWTPADADAQPSTEYTAQVELHMMEGFSFAPQCTASVLNGEVRDLSVSENGAVLSFTVVYPKTSAGLELPDIDWSILQEILGGGNFDLGTLRDLVSSGILSGGSLGFDPSALFSAASGLDASALYAAAGLDPSSLLAGTQIGSGLPEGAAAYLGSSSSSGMTAYVIALNDSMELNIDINQMDVNAVEPGMTCKVTVDALEGEEFAGEVAEVANTSTSGTTAYTARIRVEKDDRMRSGMTASAVITTSESEGALTLPVAALQEDGNRVFVYTAVDASTGEPTDEVEVETGISNGTQVEILSGLEPGTIVYYPGEDPAERMFRMMMGGQTNEDAVSVSAADTGAES